MTVKEAIRILDSATTMEALTAIEYYKGFSGKMARIKAVDTACMIAVKIMKKQEILHKCSHMEFDCDVCPYEDTSKCDCVDAYASTGSKSWRIGGSSWIHVTDKLPQVGKSVLVYESNGEMWIATRHENGLWMEDVQCLTVQPDAWQPLPEIPTGKTTGQQSEGV